MVLQQVAKNFREIFGELAPGGRGELVMQKRLRPEPQEEVDPEEDEEAGPSDRADALERYAGVKVKVGVSFGITHLEQTFFLGGNGGVCPSTV